jgi:benzoyl-CoA reductase/2-hydroxyglutaryl-CoA dehydratase subunit BcrC/BadD/HgdB
MTQRLGRDDIRGLIVLRYVFCDHWHSAVYELKKRLAIPVLPIDLDGSDALPASVVSRVQAFTEMLAG